MIIVTEGVKIKCKKCSKLYNITSKDLDEPEISLDERSMGYETQYTWDYEFECDRCSNNLHLIIDGYEYPMGILNYEESSAEGCIIIEKPILAIKNQDYGHY